MLLVRVTGYHEIATVLTPLRTSQRQMVVGLHPNAAAGVNDEYIMLNEPESYKRTNSQLFPVSNSLYLGESRIEFYNERLPPQNYHRIFTAV